jgi:hypothetical protein
VEFDREIQFRQLVVLGVTLVAITALSGVAVFYMLRGFLRAETLRAAPPPVMAPQQAEVPGPRLLARPEDELKRVRAAEDEKLGSYGWVDPAQGVSRIPIARAMERIAAEGLPARPAAGAGDAAAAPATLVGAAPAGAPPEPTQQPAAGAGEPPPSPPTTPHGAPH